MEDDAGVPLSHPGPDGRIARFEPVYDIVARNSGHRGVYFQGHPVGLITDDVVHELGRDAWDAQQWRQHVAALSLNAGQPLLMVHGHPAADRRHNPHHLLPVHLLRTANAPDASAFITDERLEGQLADHFRAAEGQSGGLSRAQVFGGGALEIGPHAHVAAK